MVVPLTELIGKNYYIVYYRIVGSRCNGSWMVKARDKSHAKKIIEKQDKDYVVSKVYVLNEKNLLDSGAYELEGDDLFLEEEDVPKRVGQAVHLECGT